MDCGWVQLSFAPCGGRGVSLFIFLSLCVFVFLFPLCFSVFCCALFLFFHYRVCVFLSPPVLVCVGSSLCCFVVDVSVSLCLFTLSLCSFVFVRVLSFRLCYFQCSRFLGLFSIFFSGLPVVFNFLSFSFSACLFLWVSLAVFLFVCVLLFFLVLFLCFYLLLFLFLPLFSSVFLCFSIALLSFSFSLFFCFSLSLICPVLFGCSLSGFPGLLQCGSLL